MTRKRTTVIPRRGFVENRFIDQPLSKNRKGEGEPRGKHEKESNVCVLEISWSGLHTVFFFFSLSCNVGGTK
jgi:hypothetical protein